MAVNKRLLLVNRKASVGLLIGYNGPAKNNDKIIIIINNLSIINYLICKFRPPVQTFFFRMSFNELHLISSPML